MLTGDFAAATVLISFGAVLGKTGPIQLLVMALIEVVLSQANEHIGMEMLHVRKAHMKGHGNKVFTNINMIKITPLTYLTGCDMSGKGERVV